VAAPGPRGAWHEANLHGCPAARGASLKALPAASFIHRQSRLEQTGFRFSRIEAPRVELRDENSSETELKLTVIEG
jgi:hypothetical protein